MNKQIWSCLLLLTFLFALASCTADDPGLVSVNPGDLQGNGDPVVAVGNSLTAGFMSGGLVLNGQLQGYANLVANQFIEGLAEGVGVDPRLPSMAMSMPLVKDGIGSESGFGLLYLTPAGALTRDPLTAAPEDLLIASGLLQPYANLGVPGAVTIDVTTRLVAAAPEGIPLPDNPFFDIVLRNSALPFNDGESVSDKTSNGTQLGQHLQIIKSVESTTALTMLWIGNNDILGRATNGSDAVAPADPNFKGALTPILDEVERTGVPMVAIANIPSITSAPYFTAVLGLLGLGGLTPADINTDDADVALILLPAQALLFPDGSLDPDYLAPNGTESLPANLTLTSTQVFNLGVAVAEYNGLIATEAASRGWALADINSELAGLPTDDFEVLNAVYPFTPPVQNVFSAFSLDGIHPSEKGYARVANVFIDAINDHPQYGPVLGAVRGGPMNNVDEAAVTNIIGFEQYVSPGPRSGVLVLDESAKRALENVMAIGR